MSKVSIIMSTYNSENTIELAVHSILSQSYKDFEFLIADDASTDQTLQKLKKIKERDNRIKVFVNPTNLGLTKTLNFLIKKSKYELIARQDADDFSAQMRIEEQVNFIYKNNLDWSTCLSKNIQTNKIMNYKSLLINKKIVMKFKNPFIHGTLMIKKNILNKIGMYNEKFYFAQDYKLYSDLFKNDYRYKQLNKVLYFSNSVNNISSNFKEQQQYFAFCVKKDLEP